MNINCLILLLSACVALSGCDQAKYRGLDGRAALERADRMDLEQAYKWYIETYKGTHPAMLDVAETFERFGAQGATYIALKAQNAGDPQEFEADMRALLILNNKCTSELANKLFAKAQALRKDRHLVELACGL